MKLTQLLGKHVPQHAIEPITQFIQLHNRRLLRLSRLSPQLLCSTGSTLALGFDGICHVGIVHVFGVLRVAGIVVEFEVLEVELKACQ